MRLFILLLAFECMIPACGKDDSKGDTTNAVTNPTLEPTSNSTSESAEKGDRGTSCTTKDTDDGAEIVCEDGSKSTIKDGAQGEDGKAVTGPKGDSGRDAEPLPVNQWYDSLTQRYWSILPAQAWVSNACGLYRFPTTSEMQTAINHGIFIASRAIGGEDDNAWTGDAGSGGHVAILPGITGADSDSQLHGVFCIKK